MKTNTTEIIGLVILVGGLATLAFATLGHIGYALYLWADSIPPATALWTAFKSWLLFTIAGFASVIIGNVLAD